MLAETGKLPQCSISSH